MGAAPATIRLARPDDAAAFVEIYAPIVRDTPISFEMEPPGVDEMRSRIAATLSAFPWLVEERDGRVAGYAYASKHRDRKAYQWSADVTCYVHADFRGQGVGKRLYTALLAIIARQGYHAAFAGITLPNAASVALHESVGFERIALYREVGYKSGAWRDVGWYQRLLGTPAAEPPAPLPLPALGPRILDDL